MQKLPLFRNVIAAAVISFAVAGFVSCTKEDANGTNNQKNRSKSGYGKDYSLREYPEYETANYSPEEMKILLEDFNTILNNENATLPDMDIKQALFLMETYFNYGVAEKVNRVATKDNEEFRLFEFSVPLANGLVMGDALKGLYHDFVSNILSIMGDRIIPLSDMYVAVLTDNSITFGLDVNPETKDVVDNAHYQFPTLFTPEEYGQIHVPSDLMSPWDEWVKTNWLEKNVWNYSIKSRLPFSAPNPSDPLATSTSTYYMYIESAGHGYTDRKDYLINSDKIWGYPNNPVPTTTTPVHIEGDVLQQLVPLALNKAYEHMAEYAPWEVGVKKLVWYEPRIWCHSNKNPYTGAIIDYEYWLGCNKVQYAQPFTIEFQAALSYDAVLSGLGID